MRKDSRMAGWGHVFGTARVLDRQNNRGNALIIPILPPRTPSRTTEHPKNNPLIKSRHSLGLLYIHRRDLNNTGSSPSHTSSPAFHVLSSGFYVSPQASTRHHGHTDSNKAVVPRVQGLAGESNPVHNRASVRKQHPRMALCAHWPTRNAV